MCLSEPVLKDVGHSQFFPMADDTKIKNLPLKAWLKEQLRMWIHQGYIISLKPATKTLKDPQIRVLPSQRFRVTDLINETRSP